MAVGTELVEGASLTEIAGVIEAATLIFPVTETVSPIFENALAQAGLPQPGDKLNNANPNVKVIRRIPVIVGIDGAVITLKVSIDYELQRPDEPARFPLRGGASLQQTQTSKRKDGTTIIVTSAAEGAATQVATVNVFQATQNIAFERVIATPFPSVRAKEFIDKVNDATFLSEPRGTWLCTAVPFDIVDESESPPRYRFTYELENDPNGWGSSVGFKKDDGTFEEGTFVDVEHKEETSFSLLMKSS